jgi:hypothetical protein
MAEYASPEPPLPEPEYRQHPDNAAAAVNAAGRLLLLLLLLRVDSALVYQVAVDSLLPLAAAAAL